MSFTIIILEIFLILKFLIFYFLNIFCMFYVGEY